MTMRGTWQTTDGGAGAGAVVGLIVAAVVVAAIAGPAAAAAAALVQMVMITVAAVVVLALAVAAVLIALRVRRGPRAPRQLPPGAIHRPVPVQRQEPRAIEQPAVHVHHHWHGVTPESVAEILRGGDGRMAP